MLGILMFIAIAITNIMTTMVTDMISNCAEEAEQIVLVRGFGHPFVQRRRSRLYT